MDKKSLPKVVKPVLPAPPYNSQFDIKKMALADKKKARIHRKQIFETASRKSKDPKFEAEKKKKMKKLYAEKGLKSSQFD